MVKLSNTQEELISDFFELKKDFAFKVEEIQALYLEVKQQRNLLLCKSHDHQRSFFCFRRRSNPIAIFWRLQHDHKFKHHRPNQ